MRLDARRISGCTLTLAMAITCGTAAAGPHEMGSPLTRLRAHEHGQVLVLDGARYVAAKDFISGRLTEFTLSDGQVVDLNVQRMEIYSPNARLVAVDNFGERELPRPDMVLFSGEVVGDPDSRVFLSMSPYGNNGFVQYDGKVHIITSGEYGFGLDTVIYNLSDLPEGTINWYEYRCGVDDIDQPMPTDAGAAVPENVPCRNIEMAVETDHEFLLRFSGNQNAANAYIATLFAANSFIYTRDVNARFTVVWSRLWLTSDDPWTATSTSTQLTQWRNYWLSNMTSVHRDLAHFLSGRNLGGGVAWLSAICTNFGYGLSANLNGFFPYPIQNNHPQNWDLMVVAHEMGHNFGAPHTHDKNPPIDGCASGDCSVTPNGTIMSYCHLCSGGMSNLRMEFHPRNINEDMLPHLASRTCDLTCPVEILFDYPLGLPEIVSPGGLTTVRVDIIDNGLAPNPAHSRIHYSINGGPVQSSLLTHLGGSAYEGQLVGGECADPISYYFAASADGSTFYYGPANGPGGDRHHALSADTFDPTFHDNCETNPGWTVTNSPGLTDGQWTRGVPVVCNRGDPPTDFDGSGQCWLTNNSRANNCNTDVDDGTTTLTSPIMDATGGEAFISYARWYSNNFGASPYADIFVVEISNNGGSTWVNLETVGPAGPEVEGGWYYRTFRVADYVAPTNQMRIRFHASDLGAGSVVEAAVDAISMRIAACASPCPGDLSGSSDANDPAYGVPDGIVDAADFFYFLDQFASGNLAVADLTGSSDPNDPAYGVPDGVIDAADFFFFLDIFVLGCP
ncbi:MAG: zinc-dependent metalloprotease [Phycisphaeraceae bacterium]|nr:zinc-dependent metalloprotease [Phycisphaeraceae bacterium]MCW5754916.1 zinc-dependent metalloprotease [Phycisphaeraceae bacterium]